MRATSHADILLIPLDSFNLRGDTHRRSFVELFFVLNLARTAEDITQKLTSNRNKTVC